MDASLGSAVGRLGLETGQFESGIDRASAKAQQLNTAFDPRQITQNLQQIGYGVAGVGTVITAGFGSAIKSAVSFETQINAIQAVTDPADWQQYGQAIEDTAIQLGQDYPVSAGEAGAAMEELAKLGVSLKDITEGGAEAVVLLSNATGTDLVTSASIAATAMNQFGYSGKDAILVADLLTNAANTSSSSVEDMGKGLSFVGNSAAALGVPMSDAATAMAIFSDRGITGARAGTALRGILQGLSKTTGTSGKAMVELGLNAGAAFSVFDDQGNIKALPEVLNQVTAATEGLTQAEKINYLRKLFGTAGGEAFLAMLENEKESLTGNARSWDEYNAAILETGTAQTSAEIRMKGVGGAVELFMGTLDSLAIRIGQVFLPSLEKVVRFGARVLDFFASLPGPVIAVGAVIGLATGLILTFVGALMIMSPFILSTVLAFKQLGLVAGKTGGPIARLSPILARLGISGAGIGRAFARIGVSILRLLNPFRLVTLAVRVLMVAFRLLIGTNPILAALTIAFLAYQTNFLGFGDLVRKVVGAITGFFSKLADVFGSTFRALTKGTSEISARINEIGGIAHKTKEGISSLAAIFYSLAAAIQTINFGPFQGAADAVIRTLQRMGGCGSGGGRSFRRDQECVWSFWGPDV